ncbi:TRAP transporter substrate-binding protein [Acuticoccus mangrovi]|uniref:TRAP transporter substrate-binding protein n=1 Tax=Acuticoccus mangrovi TaxID=2796142 RepID=A0A934MJZ4_9HYPH|nr:TRAP transporter substrate-binding protein [Acuticoccus mangrovi]MBJ3775019.1 TRAP transporter substrate-binding protein [Acuticoccus mangrovi]
MTRRTRMALAAALGLAGLTAPAGAAEIELKLAHFLPTANGMHHTFMEPWARALEECSGGKVAVEIFPGGTQLGNVAKLHDAVRRGVVDIAHGLSGLPGGRFERTRIAELPFLFSSAGEASEALWALYPDYLAPDYEGLKVLAIHAHNPGQFHTTTASVTRPEDLRGLRLRFPTAAGRAMIEALGGTPVGLPPGEVYENAEKGVIDGAVFTWETMASFNLAEVMKHHLDAGAYVTTFWFAMNEDTYESLPDDVKQCVDDLSGDALAAKFGPWWDEWDAIGLERVKAEGHEIVVLGEADRAAWRDRLQPMIEAYLAELEEKGINAREIYAAMQERAGE